MKAFAKKEILEVEWFPLYPEYFDKIKSFSGTKYRINIYDQDGNEYLECTVTDSGGNTELATLGDIVIKLSDDKITILDEEKFKKIFNIE